MKKIITFLLTLIFATCLFACDSCNNNGIKEKANAMVSNPSTVYASLSESVNGGTLKYDVTKGELYLSLKKDIGASTLANMVDEYILKNEVNAENKSYLDSVTEDEIKELIDTNVYGDEDARADLTDDEEDDKVKEFLDTMFVSNGIKATDIYDAKIQKVYRLTLAKKAYALSKLKVEIKEHNDKYAEYEALTEEEKKEAENPVTAPYYTDDKYEAKYSKDNYNTYKVIVVTFTSKMQAEVALQAIDVEIKDGVWADATTHNALTAVEVYNKYKALYSYVYGYKGATLDENYEGFNFTESELSAVNANILAHVKEMGTYATDSTNVNPDWYFASPYIVGSGSLYAYVLKFGGTEVTAFTDLDDTELESVKNQYIDELYEESLTSTYILTKLAELRSEKELQIHDTVLEISYKSSTSSYGAEYTNSELQSDTVVASVKNHEFTADELFDQMVSEYGLSALNDKFSEKRLFNDTNYNKYYQNGTWINSDKKDELTAAVEAEKTNFKNGTYTSYGYDTTTCTWTTFIEASYGVNNDDDLLIYFLNNKLATEYQGKVNYITNHNDNNEFDMTIEAAESSKLWQTFTTKMQAKIDAYYSVKGCHLLICSYKDVNAYVSGSTPIDPKDWTDEQKTKALELYAEVVAYLNDSNGTYAERFNKIVKAFTTCPYADQTFTFAGNPVATTLVSDGGNATIHVSKFKQYGLYVKYESLSTFTNGSMVEAFDAAVKEIWDKDTADSMIVPTDTTTKVGRVTVYDKAIVTEYGYHVYVNLASNQLAYAEAVTLEGVTTYRYLPTVDEIRTYTLDNSSSKLTTKELAAINTYYKGYNTDITGQYFAQAQRFYGIQALADSITGNSGWTSEDLVRYVDLYIEYTFTEYVKTADKDFLER